MKYVDYERPTSLKSALSILSEKGDVTKVLAGGTDMLVKLRVRREQPDILMDSKEIPELNELSFDPNKGLTLGAAVPLYKLYDKYCTLYKSNTGVISVQKSNKDHVDLNSFSMKILQSKYSYIGIHRFYSICI